MWHVPQRSEQGHCGIACSPLSRLAVTLLCTAGEVMQHEQQHLCVCYHCGTSSSTPSSLPPPVSKFGCRPVLWLKVALFPEQLTLVTVYMKCQSSRAQRKGGVDDALPSICSHSRDASEHLTLELPCAAAVRMTWCWTTSEGSRGSQRTGCCLKNTVLLYLCFLPVFLQ